MERPCHANIRDVRRSLRQDLLVRRLDVGVRPGHDSHQSVQIMAHGHFFRRRFGMHVDHNGGDLRLQSLHFALRNLKGAIDGGHERPPHQMKNAQRFAARRREDITAPPRHSGRIVGRTQQTRLPGEHVENLLLVPGMVASGNHRDPEIEQIIHEIRRDAEPTSDVFAVAHHDIDRVVGNQLRQEASHGPSSRLAHNVSDH